QNVVGIVGRLQCCQALVLPSTVGGADPFGALVSHEVDVDPARAVRFKGLEPLADPGSILLVKIRLSCRTVDVDRELCSATSKRGLIVGPMPDRAAHVAQQCKGDRRGEPPPVMDDDLDRGIAESRHVMGLPVVKAPGWGAGVQHRLMLREESRLYRTREHATEALERSQGPVALLGWPGVQ